MSYSGHHSSTPRSRSCSMPFERLLNAAASMHCAYLPHSSINGPLSQCLMRSIVLSFLFDTPLTKPAILYTGEEETTVTRRFTTLIANSRRRLSMARFSLSTSEVPQATPMYCNCSLQIFGNLCIRCRLHDVHCGSGVKWTCSPPLLEPDLQCRQRSLRFAE